MAENSGNLAVLKISGAAVAMVGEATTAAADLTYQITDTAKQVLDKTGTIKVQLKGANDAAEAGTSTTNIKMTAHGLVVGDLICNTSRSSVYRLVTVRVDADNVTVAAVTGQTTGDTIETYRTELTTAYSLNRLNGKVAYASAVSRVIKISGDYLTMATAGYATNMSDSRNVEILDVSAFGDTHKSRMAGLKSASGTLTQLDITDTTYATALTAGLPIVLENRTLATDEPNRYWVLLENSEIQAAVDGVQNQTVSWVSKDEWIRLGL